MSVQNWKNPWGQILDQQRADLWRVNLASSRAIRNGGSITMLESLKATYSAMPAAQFLSQMSEEDFDFFPLSVAIPELRIVPEAFTNTENQPAPLPGFDEPVGGVRMVFRVETSEPGRVSRIIQLLQCWRDAARAGRSTGQNDVPMLLPGGVFPVFRFDVVVRLYAGARLLSDRNFAYNKFQLVMPPSFTVLLSKAWVSAINVSDLDYSKNGEGVTVTATLFPANIRYNPSNDELAEYAAKLGNAVSFNADIEAPALPNTPRSQIA